MTDSPRARALHIFALFGFACAQPLFDLLGRHAEFFVARGSEPGDVLFLVLLWCVLLPGLIVLVVQTCCGRARHVVHALTVASLSALIVLPVLKQMRLPGALLAGIALAIGAGFLFSYLRWRWLRTYLTALAPAALVFPALFLLNGQVSKVVWSNEAVDLSTANVRGATPVVFVVFDEFPLISLLDEKRQIDVDRYPHFAELARTAIWHRNATTVHEWTQFAVPALLTGRFCRETDLPTLADHPRNLFTLLGGSCEVRALETMTRLCPRRLLKERVELQTPLQRLAPLAADCGLIQLHQLLPPEWTAKLPAVTQSWSDFCGCGQPQRLHADRRRRFDDFLASIEPADRPRLYFLHLLLPHGPFTFLPSGKSYGGTVIVDGLSGGTWSDEEQVVELAWQRHLLQVGFVDRLVGQLLDRLRKVGLFDEALLVLAADHGISFRPGDRYRELSDSNAADILRVPLFIKRPGQKRGEIDDRNAQSIDVLPTIAAALDVPLPWPVDGRSLLDRSAPEPKEKIVQRRGGRRTFSPTMDDDFGSLDRQLALFGTGAIRPAGAHTMLCRRIEDLDVDGTGEAVVTLHRPEAFADVNVASDFVPAQISGEVAGPAGAVTLAVAVNGTIRAVTSSFAAGGGQKWSALLPETSFRPGPNDVEVFQVISASRLTRTSLSRGGPSANCELIGSTGSEWLRIADGRCIPVIPKAAQGCLDWVQVEGDSVQLAGWAADLKNGQPAEAVVVLADGQCVYSGRTDVDRLDVARRHRQPALRWSGFSLSFRRGRFDGSEAPRVRLFAVSKAGAATELTYPEWYQRAQLRPW